MKVVIVEDEIAAAENLTYLINSIDSSIEIVKVLDSVKASVEYFLKNNEEAELVLMDIHLADGISFEIFDQVSLNIPIIFTTAYDQYAIKAFKVNSVDYLLKPINEEELAEAINKFKNISIENTQSTNNLEGLMQLLQTKNKTFKTTYLVHHRDELRPIKTDDMAYFYIESGIVKGVTFTNKAYIIDKKLEDIESELDPELFHRVNRQFVVNRNSVANIKFYFNGKLIMNVNPPSSERIIISKAKASEVKSWMNM